MPTAGRYVSPDCDGWSSKQLYLPDTNVLITPRGRGGDAGLHCAGAYWTPSRLRSGESPVDRWNHLAPHALAQDATCAMGLAKKSSARERERERELSETGRSRLPPPVAGWTAKSPNGRHDRHQLAAA